MSGWEGERYKEKEKLKKKEKESGWKVETTPIIFFSQRNEHETPKSTEIYGARRRRRLFVGKAYEFQTENHSSPLSLSSLPFFFIFFSPFPTSFSFPTPRFVSVSLSPPTPSLFSLYSLPFSLLSPFFEFDRTSNDRVPLPREDSSRMTKDVARFRTRRRVLSTTISTFTFKSTKDGRMDPDCDTDTSFRYLQRSYRFLRLWIRMLHLILNLECEEGRFVG